LQKHDIRTDTLVFIFNSPDEYMKRAFIARGWVENPIAQSQFFDIRWDLNENNVNFSIISNGQLCNHFANNQELTTKTGLARNLQKIAGSENFFPRCYDFTDEKQISEFLADFNRTGIFNLLKKYSNFFKKAHRKELLELKRQFDKFSLDTCKTQYNYENRKRIKNIYKARYSIENTEENKNYEINTFIIKAALLYTKIQYLNRNGDFEKENLENIKLSSYIKQCKNYEEILANISTYNFPYTEDQKFEISVYFFYNLKKELIKNTTNQWTKPNLYIEYKIIKSLQKLREYFPQLDLDGDRNIWIMKPGFSSRGQGVRCFNTTKEVFIKDKRMQAKVVQKYIERPFLLDIPNTAGKLEKRKFDIRQWVLVTSFNPLEIYMFSSCYLRLCGSEYQIDNFHDKFSHISNYSVQKKNSNVENIKKDLVMSLEQFEDFFSKTYKKYFLLHK